mgnify:CR=1 FL=1
MEDEKITITKKEYEELVQKAKEVDEYKKIVSDFAQSLYKLSREMFK